MKWRHRTLRRLFERACTAAIAAVLVFEPFGYVLIRTFTETAEAAQVTIDADAQIDGPSHIQAGSQTVFVSDQTGYKFFRDASGACVYRKTTDGGVNWNSPVTVDAQTDCIAVTVWYDRWTLGDVGNYIHISTMDTTLDDMFYNRLDTSSDTLLMGTSPVDVSTNSGNSVATMGNGTNYNTMAKGTDGTLYMAVADASDSYVVECTTGCNVTTGWTETGTNPMDVANDYNILVPLPSGDIMLINRDISAEDIRYKIWNNSSWSSPWVVIDANATDNTAYDVGMAVTTSSSTPGAIFLAYTADNATLGTDDDVRTAYYNGSTWASTTPVVSNLAARAITGVAIALDASTEEVYVGYTARSTAGTPGTGNVYWKKSSDLMQNWDAEMGPINSSADDYFGIDFNILNDQRIYATWFDNTDDDIYGDTVVDLFPGVYASTTGSQIASVTASTSNVYLGGAFVLTENRNSTDVNGITITENSSIDAATDIANVKLFYEMDMSAPYNCASESYGGSESQFGATDANGFSGANGISSFTGSTVSVSTTSAMCIYVVLDVLDSTSDASTINVFINNPESDISLVSGIAGPQTAQEITGTTAVVNDEITQTHYHWRNDNGSEATATSRTGGVEDTSLTALQRGANARLRLGISNEGGTSTPPVQYRLEYAPTTGACSEASGWTDVGTSGGEFEMYDSSNLTHGANTTDVLVGDGGVSDENTTFLTPNGAVRDTSSETGAIVLTQTQYVDLEYSILASTTATEGNTYCFRVTDQGTPLFAYDQLARATIAADVSVTVATTSQTASTSTPSTNLYIGSAFVITENSNSRTVTGITLTETGTVDAQTGLDNIRLYYDLDTSNPYNCVSESYGGTESQFGSTDTDGFSGPNGSSSFSGSVGISTTSTLCLYTVLDTTDAAQNGETINITIENPATDVVVSGGGSVSPSTPRDLNGSTTLVGAVLTQTHYHWRNDNGTEATATSKTSGVEDTPITSISEGEPVRLRLQVSNEGSVTSPSRAFRLEYGTRISSCDAVSVWTDVGALDGAWDMYDSTHVTDGTDTTDIANGDGGVSNENSTFLTPNAAVKDTSSTIATTSITSTEYLEAEFAIVATEDAGFDVPYCFRLATADVSLNVYSQYAELTTAPERDFKIQRGTFTLTGTTQTLTAGVDYITPASSSSAFIRITNSQHTGAGRVTLGGNQNADDVSVYILNPSNITSSVTFTRIGAANNTRVSWEIIEFIGTPGSDNEIIVRDQGALTYGTLDVSATGTAVSGISDDADVVVLITGQATPDTGLTNYNSLQSTSEWLASTNQPLFERGVAGGDAVRVSYAVVEFTGLNWYVQRSEHTYTNAGTTETESITPVNSLSRTFLHAQKRIGNALTGLDEFGAEVWLSSIGQVSYFLQSGATTPSDQTSVAWVIENVQTNAGGMEVTRSNGNSTGGTEPLTLSVSIGKTLSDLTNASIFVNNRAAGTGTNYPRPILGATIASTTHYELWRSDTGTAVDYRTEIVEWPTAGLAIRQNYYRFYVDDGLLDPLDPWPLGTSTDLGENTVLTGADEPLGESERVRLRMSLRVTNATFPAGTKAFRLQYGEMNTTCSAIPENNWYTLGDNASSTIWRGYNVTGLSDGTLLSVDPPTIGDLNLSVSDVAGTFEEINDTGANTFSVDEGDDIEYDWVIEQNGADAESYYCFRMVESDGTALASYINYPQLRTASFTPRSQNWRWYDDESSVTPVVPLALENTAPIDLANEEALKLRITVQEVENIARDDVRFRLQYSEHADFLVAEDVVSTGACTATSTWCYVDGGGTDNAVIPDAVLSDAASCIASVGDGCGTHNESPDALTGFRHEGSTATEYEFAIQSAGPRVNRVYYFRLYDVVQDIPVPTNAGESYPSLVTEGASLSFSMTGLTSGQSIEGVTLDVTTTPQTLHFGSIGEDTLLEGAHRLTIDTNGTEGYTILMSMDGELMSAGGATIQPIGGTNAAPVAWASGCLNEAPSCFGYHAGDDTLTGGSARFAAVDTYAAVSTTTPEEIAHSSQPVSGEVNDIVYRILRRASQDAGEYEAHIQYISVPEF